MQFKASNLDQVTQKRIKISLLYCLSHINVKNNYWKLLNGIAELGYQWSHIDVSIRRAIELPIQQYLNLSLVDWDTFSAKEIVSILTSLRSMKTTWAGECLYGTISMII